MGMCQGAGLLRNTWYPLSISFNKPHNGSCNSDSQITEHIPKDILIIRKVLEYNIYRVWLRSVSIVQYTLAEIGVLKFIQNNANSKTDVGQCLEILQRNFFKKNTRQISSIKTDALMNSVHNTSHYTDMAVDMVFISSEILSLRLCKSPECAWNTLLSK